MRVFSGFPAGKARLISLPDQFFSDLLPIIDDLTELKVTLHVFWRLSQRQGYPRYLSATELAGDAALIASLECSSSPAEAVQEGLRRTVTRGTLLRVELSGGESIYLLNSEKGRQAVDQARRGGIELGGQVMVDGGQSRPERPTIFGLYEQNIGLLQPMLVEELKEAETTYPPEWIEEAFREAVARNKRSWRYILAILQGWEADGRQDPREDRDDRRRYVEGRYSEYFERRSQDE